MDNNIILDSINKNKQWILKTTTITKENEEIFKKIVKINNSNIKFIPTKMFKNEDFFLEIFKLTYHNKYNGKFLYLFFQKTIPNMIQNTIQNKNLIMKLLKIDHSFFKILTMRKVITIKLAIKIIKKYPNLFIYLNSKYKFDKELILLALNNKSFNEDNINSLSCSYYKEEKYYDERYHHSSRYYGNEEYYNKKSDYVNECIYHHLKKDKEIKFKSYNIMLRKGIITYDDYLNHFSKIKKFDPFEFFKKGNYLYSQKYSKSIRMNRYIYNKNIKFCNALILRCTNINLIYNLSKKNNKYNIIKYLSFLYIQYISEHRKYLAILYKIIKIFNNDYDILIYLLKINKCVLSVIKTDKKALYDMNIIKIFLKKNLFNDYYILKYKYHHINDNDNNINILFINAIKSNDYRYFYIKFF